MKVVGNCPECGNPIWASSPEDTKRTCFCVVTQKTAPITINPQPQPYGPHSPWIQPCYPMPGTQWTCEYPSATITTGNTTTSYVTPRPPDDDGALVS